MELERQERILSYLKAHQRLNVEAAASLLGVSAITARRDFRDLAARGLVRRTRGAILAPATAPAGILPFVLREAQHSTAKQQLAQAAAALFRPHDVIIVDGGTTTFHLCTCLPDLPLKIITNSIRLAAALEDRRQGRAWPEIHLTGGFLYPDSGVLLGPGARRSLIDYYANWTLLSVGGIDANGITNTHDLVAELERTMIDQAQKVAILADRSKLGKPAMSRVCGLDRIKLLITNPLPCDEPLLDQIRAAGVEVLALPPTLPDAADIAEHASNA